jgi:hypothetical protein
MRIPLLDLELQDLTGLVRAASGWCVLPPEMAAGDAAPFRVFGEERHEGLGIAAVESFGCGAKPVDHHLSIPGGRNVRLPGTLHVEWLQGLKRQLTPSI